MLHNKCYNHQKSGEAAGIMELYFETYLILALVFIIIGFVVAGPFLKSRKHTIWLSALVLFLGFFGPYGLIFLQRYCGSLVEISKLLFYKWMVTENITLEHLRYIEFLDLPLVTVVWRVFMEHIAFSIVSEVVGLVVGVLAYLFYRKRTAKQL
jgi:hypothetical protein